MSKFGRWTAGQKLSDVLNISDEQLKKIKELQKSKNIPKRREEQEARKFKERMNAIVQALPIDDDRKEEIHEIIQEYSIEFPLYAQCQSSDSEEENTWITSLLPVSLMVLDNIE